MKKVISWCFFVDKKSTNRLPEYLFGLKCNKIASAIWFPEWSLRLYVHKSIEIFPSVFKYINDICESPIGPRIDLIYCRDGFNPTVERYRPFLETDVDVCIARDVDSILSKTDADYVNKWLNGEYGDVDIMCYREYMQPEYLCMGGGIAVKTQRFLTLHDIFYATPNQVFSRGIDETQLGWFMKYGKCHHIVAKMSCSGVYFICNDYTAKPSESELLWNVPFYNTLYGYMYEYEGCDYLIDAEIDVIVALVKKIKIKPEHTHTHSADNLKNVLAVINNDWIR